MFYTIIPFANINEQYIKMTHKTNAYYNNQFFVFDFQKFLSYALIFHIGFFIFKNRAPKIYHFSSKLSG